MPPNRNRPAGDRAARTEANLYPYLNGHRRQDGYAAPTPEDRADLEVLIAAAERGFRLAVKCVDCGHWLVSARSIAAHRGPRCRSRVAM
jgi:hypothetical protein